MRPDVMYLAKRVAKESGLELEELLFSRLHEHARARHRWRALVADSLGYGAPDGVSLSELGRLLECDRDSIRNSFRRLARAS
jgi:hypothetical protein